MSTQTRLVPRTAPNQTPQRIPFPAAVALIQGAHTHDGLPFPYGIEQPPHADDLIALKLRTVADLHRWVEFFGADAPRSTDCPAVGVTVWHAYRHVGVHWSGLDFGPGWHGWAVHLSADVPLDTCETPEESAAIVDANLRAMGSRGLNPAPEADARVDELVTALTGPTAAEVQVETVNPIVYVRKAVGGGLQRAELVDDNIPGRPGVVRVIYLQSRTGAVIARSRLVDPVPMCETMEGCDRPAPHGQPCAECTAHPVHAEVSTGPGGIIGVSFPTVRVDELAVLLAAESADDLPAAAS